MSQDEERQDTNTDICRAIYDVGKDITDAIEALTAEIAKLRHAVKNEYTDDY